MNGSRAALVTGIVFAMAGCVAELEDPELETAEQAVTYVPWATSGGACTSR